MEEREKNFFLANVHLVHSSLKKQANEIFEKFFLIIVGSNLEKKKKL